MVTQVNCQREDPLESGNKDHLAFWKTLALATLFYFTSATGTLRSRNDLSGYCSDTDEPSTEEGTRCYVYSDTEVFTYNYLIWGSGFFLFGLQFTHLDVGFMQGFTLSWDSMKIWSIKIWIFFSAIVGLLCLILATVFYSYF